MVKFLNTFFLPVIFAVLITGCENSDNNTTVSADNGEWKRVINLAGEWKFSVGDNPKWSAENMYDENWEKILVPSSWENQGFHGYDGYAWYRKVFELNYDLKNNSLYLFLGYVDDVDQVYINGHLVGFSGTFPPGYRTAYNIFRRYPLPNNFLKFGQLNTIAVRVYDEQLEGGITGGDIGIYTEGQVFQNSVGLVGTWKFQTGDNPAWKNVNFNDSSWSDIIVPGHWETQGHPDYDGFAWYRKTVFVPDNFKKDRLILVLGKIDDYDEAYINGKLVGSTGNMNDPNNLGEVYQKFRGYYLSSDDLKYGAKNVIAVRVYDGFREGGIYEGPAAIVPMKDFTDYWNKIRHESSVDVNQ
jgi:sialate O-acetylesterase